MSFAINFGSAAPSFRDCCDQRSLKTITTTTQCLPGKRRPKPGHELLIRHEGLVCWSIAISPAGLVHESNSASTKRRGGLNKRTRNLNGSGSNGIPLKNGSRRGQMLRNVVVRDSGRAMAFDEGTKQQQKKKKKRWKKPAQNAQPGPASSGFWRLFGVEVPLERDPGKDSFSVSDALLEGVASALKCHAAQLPHSSLSVVRKSLDARKDPRFVYTIDLDVENFLEKEAGAKLILSKLRARIGKAEFHSFQKAPVDLVARFQDIKTNAVHTLVGNQLELHGSVSGLNDSKTVSKRPEQLSSSSGLLGWPSRRTKAKVVVVGSGPAGLFAALSLAESGIEVVLLERGQPVETRGRDIGALMVRRLLNPNSNLCYGEGGAGTWSDGKLTTQIGKNSSSVQTVLATLVRFGAPPQILVDGKPHVGTDKLVRILQNLRSHLLAHGVSIMFGTKMEDLEVHRGRVTGVRISTTSGKVNSVCNNFLEADAVVLGVGHSARDVYDRLLQHNVQMTAKPFAVGFRIEHPQELINEMQYHRWANEVQNGKGKLPVADYKLVADVGLPTKKDSFADKDFGGRGCFSFCMCPGGQVVPTSTSSSELCINGMSFSNRASKWANAALVVSVSSSDFLTSGANNDPLAGVAFQRAIEQEAALRGGGSFVAPVQTVTDFLDNRLSRDSLPSSSYRLGVKAAFLHDLLPSHLTESLKGALVSFNQQLPGFIDKQALLHGVETRTSSPVRIERDKETFESMSLAGLYPIGEGAGHAGGIVSAAVDGYLAQKRSKPTITLRFSNILPQFWKAHV